MEKHSNPTSMIHGTMPDAVFVTNPAEISDALALIKLDVARPVLVIVGGASKISPADFEHLQQLFVQAIAPLAENLGIAVVDGATDAGVMKLIGQARAETSASFPLIGVAATGTVILPNRTIPSQDAAPLEPNHTHFVFVPGSNWGDESPWLARVAGILANGFPSVTLVINGGEITWQDVSCSIQTHRPVITLDGSGRTADQLAAAVRGEASDERGKTLVASGLVQAIHMRAGYDALTELIAGMLSS